MIKVTPEMLKELMFQSMSATKDNVLKYNVAIKGGEPVGVIDKIEVKNQCKFATNSYEKSEGRVHVKLVDDSVIDLSAPMFFTMFEMKANNV